MRLNNRRKLQPDDVKKIRMLYVKGSTPKQIHAQFPQVTIWNIYKILQFASWPLVTYK